MDTVVEIDVAEFQLVLNRRTSKYRTIIEEFIKSENRIGKIVFDFPALAGTSAKTLRGWVKEGENIKILHDQYNVYLVKEP